MINSRIALSVASIAAAGTLVAGAAFAVFSDSRTSTLNDFSTGTLNLALCDGDQPCPSPNLSQSVTATFGGTNLAPGGACTGVQTLTIRNNGSIDAGSVTLGGSNSNNTLSKFLKISSIKYDGVNVTVPPQNGNGFTDLDDLTGPAITLGSVLTGNTQKNLTMEVCLDSSADNTLQGLTDTLTLTVNLNQ